MLGWEGQDEQGPTACLVALQEICLQETSGGPQPWLSAPGLQVPGETHGMCSWLGQAGQELAQHPLGWGFEGEGSLPLASPGPMTAHKGMSGEGR